LTSRGLTVQVWWNDMILQQDVQDQHRWKLTASGQYSSKFAAFFVGTIKFAPWRQVYKTWAPLRCKFFIWLALNNRCWMADRLAKRGLPHPAACPFCDQAEETICWIICCWSCTEVCNCRPIFSQDLSCSKDSSFLTAVQQPTFTGSSSHTNWTYPSIYKYATMVM
jgi:hypothetical protein